MQAGNGDEVRGAAATQVLLCERAEAAAVAKQQRA